MSFLKKAAFTFTLFLCMAAATINAQNAPFALPYQAVARNASGVVIPNQNIQVKVGVYAAAPSGTPEWEEMHAVTTDTLGLFKIAIGQGISTTLGSLSSFSLINWQAAAHYIKVEIDFAGGSSFTTLGSSQLVSVPYAFFSNKSGRVTGISMNSLLDADTAGIQNGYLLKWTGTVWAPMPDNHRDTVSFAYNSGHAATTDTSFYALHNSGITDTVAYAYQSGTAASSAQSQDAQNASHGVYADTATYALNYLPFNWSVNGNTIGASGSQLNTADSTALVLKTSSLERLRFSADGKTGVGTAAPAYSFEISGNDGITQTGTFGSGDTTVPALPGTYMLWYPRRSAFRVGTVTGNQWANFNIGDYTFASGYNSLASGIYSSAMGNASSVTCIASIAMGNKCSVAVLTGVDDGGSVAMGDSCTVTATRSVAMGYHCVSDGGYAFGYNNRNLASGGNTFSFGANNIATAGSTMVWGSYGSSNGKTGIFVYSDASSTAITAASANNQFVVRASGGTVFYSDAGATTGVVLFPGSGSWASTSDKNKKENFSNVNGEELLAKIGKLKITSWNYKAQSASIRHIGPMAQDFYKSFKLDNSKRTINTVDIDGVTLLAVKSLYARILVLNTSFDTLESIKEQANNITDSQDALEQRLGRLQQLITH